MNIRRVTPLLQIFDMERSIEFYQKSLGFTVVATSGGGRFYWAMLRSGDATLMLNTAYDDEHRPSSPDAVRVSVHADTILYFDCDSADEVYDHLSGQGMNPQEPITTHYGARQIYIKDPDGYELCFQHAAEA